MTFFGLIPWLAGFLLRRKPSLGEDRSSRLAGAIVWAAAIAAAVAIALLVKGWWEERIRSDEREIVRTERLEDSVAGFNRATAGNAARRDAATEDSEAAQADLDRIHAEDPGSSVRPASRGTRRVAERLPQEN